jgi:ribulose-5-phosphate 4-epimerase/fuculose-1-phosphate aldolase
MQTLIDEIVLANHILYDRGVVDAYGHVSARHPDRPEQFLLTWAIAPALATAADVLTFDAAGNALDNPAGKELYSERFIHAAIYAARPDVLGIVHSHSENLIPYTVTDVPLRPLYHMSAFLGAGTAMYDPQPSAGDTDLLVKTLPLGVALASALGEKSIVLMRRCRRPQRARSGVSRRLHRSQREAASECDAHERTRHLPHARRERVDGSLYATRRAPAVGTLGARSRALARIAAGFTDRRPVRLRGIPARDKDLSRAEPALRRRLEVVASGDAGPTTGGVDEVANARGRGVWAERAQRRDDEQRRIVGHSECIPASRRRRAARRSTRSLRP